MKQRQVIREINEPGIGDIKIFNLTAKFSRTPAQVSSPPPRLSAHTDGILAELGSSEEEIRMFKEKSVI